MSDASPRPRKRPDVRREDARFRLLRALEADPGLSQRALARGIGLSLGAANALLNAAIDAGLVQVVNGAPTPARFRPTYHLTPGGHAAKAQLAPRFLARRRGELVALSREIAALETEIGPDSADPG